jgi:2-dehydropantoate 2-reductase
MADILIYGAGAIGSFIGYLLSQAPPVAGGKIENVALLGREDHIRAIKESGLLIDLAGERKLVHFQHCFENLDDLNGSDFYPQMVIICVKTYSLPALCRELAHSGLMQGRLKDAVFLLLMNGMGNREAFAPLHLPGSRLLEGITAIGVKLSGDGRIELKGKGKTMIEARLDEQMQKFMGERLAEKGFEMEFPANFAAQQWNKLFINCVINPITALTRQENGIVLSLPLQETVQSIIGEAVGVAAEEGIAADERKVLDIVSSVAGKTAGNTSSMLQDVLKGRMTEIDSINGYIIAQAKKHDLRVPVNEALLALVKSASSGKNRHEDERWKPEKK